jgi:hypothetical protein
MEAVKNTPYIRNFIGYDNVDSIIRWPNRSLAETSLHGHVELLMLQYTSQ